MNVGACSGDDDAVAADGVADIVGSVVLTVVVVVVSVVVSAGRGR